MATSRNDGSAAAEFFGQTVRCAVFGEFRAVETRHAAFEVLPEHVHVRPYATFVVEGEYAERVGRTSSVVLRRSVVLHPAGECHANRFSGGTARLINIEMPARLDPQPARRLESAGEPSTWMIGERIRGELRLPDELSPMVVEGLMIELHALLLRGASRRLPNHDSAAQRADRLIDERLTEPISLRDLADALRVDRAHLSRLFRREIGCTIGERIRQRRIERACEILLRGTPLAEVADAVGFSDQSHFTRAFRTVLGVTPGEYRRQVR